MRYLIILILFCSNIYSIEKEYTINKLDDKLSNMVNSEFDNVYHYLSPATSKKLGLVKFADAGEINHNKAIRADDFRLNAFQKGALRAENISANSVQGSADNVQDGMNKLSESINQLKLSSGTLDNSKVNKSGDTMVGNLQMSGADITLSAGDTVDGVDVSDLNTQFGNHSVNYTNPHQVTLSQAIAQNNLYSGNMYGNGDISITGNFISSGTNNSSHFLGSVLSDSVGSFGGLSLDSLIGLIGYRKSNNDNNIGIYGGAFSNISNYNKTGIKGVGGYCVADAFSKGVHGEADGGNGGYAMGVYGKATCANGTTTPERLYSIYGDAPGNENGWAGYFNGNVSATKYYGNGDTLTGVLHTGDNFGNHIATKTMDLGGYSLGNSSSITANYFHGNGADLTALATGHLLTNTSAQINYTNSGIFASTATILKNHLNNTSNPHTVTLGQALLAGNSSNQDMVLTNSILYIDTITSYNGNDLGFNNNDLVNIKSIAFENGTFFNSTSSFHDNLGNHIATQNLNMASNSIDMLGGNINNGIAFYSQYFKGYSLLNQSNNTDGIYFGNTPLIFLPGIHFIIPSTSTIYDLGNLSVAQNIYSSGSVSVNGNIRTNNNIIAGGNISSSGSIDLNGGNITDVLTTFSSYIETAKIQSVLNHNSNMLMIGNNQLGEPNGIHLFTSFSTYPITMTGGNVLIGTNRGMIPDQKLNVIGNISASGIIVSSGGFYGDGSHLSGVTGTIDANCRLSTGTFISLSSANASYIPISNSGANFMGNVGIGITNPERLLSVNGIIETLGSAGGFLISPRDGSGSNFIWYNQTGDNLRLYNDSPVGDLLTILGNGNVGIGTTNPRTTLEVSSGVYIGWNCSADNYTDRTPYPKDLKEAYDSINSMNRKLIGGVDHEKLNNFIKVKRETKREVFNKVTKSTDTFIDIAYERNVSATVSAQNEVIKDLIKRIEKLEKK